MKTTASNCSPAGMAKENKMTNEVKRPASSTEPQTEVALGGRVLLFNDDVHTFDEVIGQLMLALGCAENEAFCFAYDAHTNGSASVFHGKIEECLRVSSTLEAIGLVTQVSCE